MSPGFWTLEKMQRLRQLAGAGYSAAVTAELLHCSRNQAMSKAWRMGISFASDGGQIARTRGLPPKSVTFWNAETQTDPHRADRVLRRFSWEAQTIREGSRPFDLMEKAA